MSKDFLTDILKFNGRKIDSQKFGERVEAIKASIYKKLIERSLKRELKVK
jgi:hypothetical protein